MMLDTTPELMIGKYVQLEPMTLDHTNELAYAGRDPSIWRFMLYGMVTDQKKMRAWVEDILQRKSGGTDEPYVVRDLKTGRLVGASRYMNINRKDKGLEIGGTWYDPEFQRTYVNTETKFLMLESAFEKIGVIRVQFKADSRNEKSLKAIERLGAKKEGVLRNHMLLEDGTFRHSVFYSILPEEWPEISANLTSRLYR